MKRIALFISQLNSGGAERVVSRSAAILGRGFDVDIIVYDDVTSEYTFSNDVISLKVPTSRHSFLKPFVFLKRLNKLKDIKKRNKYYAVLSFLDTPNLLNILSKTKETLVIPSVRNFDFDTKSRFGKLVDNFVYKHVYIKSDKITVVSKEIMSYITIKYQLPTNKIKVLYNPYNILEILTLAKKESHYPKTTKIRIVSMGRIMYQKGYWHLVKAFNSLWLKGYDIELVIIGKEYDSGKLANLISILPSKNSIHLIGQVTNPFPILKSSDIYVQSSLFEGFPNALVEAMICGLPIISSNCSSGPGEILEAESVSTEMSAVTRFGILIPKFDFSEDYSNELTAQDINLSLAIEKLIIDEKLREELSTRSIERSKYFSDDIYFERIKEIID